MNTIQIILLCSLIPLFGLFIYCIIVVAKGWIGFYDRLFEWADKIEKEKKDRL